MNTVRNNCKKLTFGEIKVDSGLKTTLAKNPMEVIDEVLESKIKGRGGAGFPTGLKWKLCREAPGDEKFVVCNADEGEPGTFKDRVILTEHADLVFEGMTIGAYAIGAMTGIVYLRGEFTYLRKHLDEVLEKRRANNLLGKNVMGKKGFDFDIEVRLGAGAYVCGEETALIESLEGQRGEPRNRPPFPVDTGFMDRPTFVNNVETFAWVSSIMSKGAAWFKSIGTEQSTGHKLFSVSGDVDRPGVYEYPLGITIKQILDEAGARNPKAAQIGGASGQCIPASQFDRSISFEDVSTGGSVIVFGQHRDMLDAAQNFLEFFCEESCGQCTPCRIGNEKLLETVHMLKEGHCSMKYLREISKLGETMKIASKCGLGQSSPNAFLSIVEHFKHEIMGRIPTTAKE